jgi:hypothetical protein
MRKVFSVMAGTRVRSQKQEGLRDLAQYIPGQTDAALAYKIGPNFAEIVFRFWREYIACHLTPVFQCIQFRNQFSHDSFAVQAFALTERFEALCDFGVDIIPAEPTPLRQIPHDGLADQITRGSVLFGCRCP